MTTVTGSFSYSRFFRLTRPAEFQQVFAKARRSGDHQFTVLYASNELDFPRLGFVVAKKKVPSAVDRNRIRRIGRESFRQHRNTLGGIDIIILAQHAAGKSANADLFTSLEKHWRRLKEGADSGRRTRPQ